MIDLNAEFRVVANGRKLVAGYKLIGALAYYGLPSNMRSMVGFAYEVRRLWLRALARRSQRGMTWDRFNRLMKVFPLPMPTATRSTSAKSALATG